MTQPSPAPVRVVAPPTSLSVAVGGNVAGYVGGLALQAAGHGFAGWALSAACFAVLFVGVVRLRRTTAREGTRLRRRPVRQVLRVMAAALAVLTACVLAARAAATPLPWLAVLVALGAGAGSVVFHRRWFRVPVVAGPDPAPQNSTVA